jgi:hypothetical protein
VTQADPPPWIPALTAHTTGGASDNAELYMVRAVDTGIINVRHTIVSVNAAKAC